METRRRALLNKLETEMAASGSGGTSAAVIADHMRAVLALNRRMIALGERSKTELLEAMGGLTQGRKAVNAYYGV